MRKQIPTNQVLHTYSVSEQVALHLREGIRQGKWKDFMPGRDRLALELGVSPWSVQRGLDEMEKEGLLLPQGGRKRRQIVIPMEMREPRKFRIYILLYEDNDRKLGFLVELQHRLQEMGHTASFADKDLLDLKMDAKRVAKYVGRHPADAWVVVAASREVLAWFADQSIPAFALFGRWTSLSLAAAAPSKGPAMTSIMQELFGRGHRRIVMVTREDRRKPIPGWVERIFLAELEAKGIQPGAYHLPEWKETVPGFHRMLDQLFKHTPPTALIISEAHFFIAAREHLALRGIIAPDHVSMICLDPSTAYEWCDPAISHVRWEAAPLVKRITRWVDNVARGRDDRRKMTVKAVFIKGGTIGPVVAKV